MKAIVLLSGGIDSTTCLAMAIKNHSAGEVMAINLYYGQKHAKEILAARNVAKHYGIEITEFDLSQF